MRIPSDIAIAGGQSDCRNQTMHQMFLMIGLGERAGSGLPKIKEGWNSTNGKLSLYESYEPYEQTILEMNWSEKEKNLPKNEGVNEGVSISLEDKNILDLLQKNKLTISDLSFETGKSITTIERKIRKFKKYGFIRRIGSDKGGYWEVIKSE